MVTFWTQKSVSPVWCTLRYHRGSLIQYSSGDKRWSFLLQKKYHRESGNKGGDKLFATTIHPEYDCESRKGSDNMGCDKLFATMIQPSVTVIEEEGLITWVVISCLPLPVPHRYTRV